MSKTEAVTGIVVNVATGDVWCAIDLDVFLTGTFEDVVAYLDERQPDFKLDLKSGSVVDKITGVVFRNYRWLDSENQYNVYYWGSGGKKTDTQEIKMSGIVDLVIYNGFIEPRYETTVTSTPTGTEFALSLSFKNEPRSMPRYKFFVTEPTMREAVVKLFKDVSNFLESI